MLNQKEINYLSVSTFEVIIYKVAKSEYTLSVNETGYADYDTFNKEITFTKISEAKNAMQNLIDQLYDSGVLHGKINNKVADLSKNETYLPAV